MLGCSEMEDKGGVDQGLGPPFVAFPQVLHAVLSGEGERQSQNSWDLQPSWEDRWGRVVRRVTGSANET